MKKIFAFLLAAILLLGLTGCEVLDYRSAMNHYNNGNPAKAYEEFLALGDFADSAAMAEKIGRELDYERAAVFMERGEYQAALDLYKNLGMYMDSPVKAVDAQYFLGLSCLEKGAYEEAISWLTELGSYQDSSDNVLRARWLWLCRHISDSGGSIQIPAGEGFVYLTVSEENRLILFYSKEGYILGMPYTSELSFILTQGSTTAPFTALYTSVSTSQIREEATGTAELSGYTGDAALPIETFTQVNVDPDGVETVSNDTRDALMMQVILAEANRAIADNLAALLSQTNVDITPAQLGFDAL